MSESKLVLVEDDPPAYMNEKGETLYYLVDRYVDGEPPTLYRYRHDGNMLISERLKNSEWVYDHLLDSLQFDAIVDDITIEEAREIAKQLGKPFVE